jgi:hypothetical protein
LVKLVTAAFRTSLCAVLTVAAAFGASTALVAQSAAPALHPFQHFGDPKPASVRMTRSAEGRVVIVNENTVQHARRFSGTLLPVPDVPGLPAGSLEPMIQRHCDAQRMDARLVRAVIQVESGYNLRARSNKGALGLMQLMPETAAELAVHNPFDIEENLRGGITYLRQMIDTFPDSLEKAIAAYNAGPGAVERHGGIPPYPDTVDYVRRVMALYLGDGGQIAQAAFGRASMASVAPAARAARRAGPVAMAAVRYSPAPSRRPAPYVTRGANGRLVVTTSLSTLH